MASPDADELEEAFVKDGVVLVNGPGLIDLLSAPDLDVSGTSLTGNLTFTGRTFARLAAFAGHFYVDVHTSGQPVPGPGICRGQCQFVAGDIPPANL
jgi:hypothetical protein